MFTKLSTRMLILLASVCTLLVPAAALAVEGVVTAGTIVLRQESDPEAKKLLEQLGR